MNRDDESYFDAIFISPHKFLGGPGASGLLVFNDKIYHKDLPPTVGGGGTVDYVSPHGHDYVTDIEEREKAGTPGTLQVLKAALALEVKEAIGVSTIERIELKHIRAALERFNNHERIIVLGNPSPEKRISIVSFNIRHEDKILHPKFVTRLLNDLFGIQSRAGCSCAGPYGHALLKIDRKLSEKYRRQILKGYNGIKPGWVRVGFHFTLDDGDVEFMCRAIEFVADHGHLFLPLYSFDPLSGTWSHLHEPDEEPIFSLERAIKCSESFQAEGSTCERSREYDSYFVEAQRLMDELKELNHQYQSLDKDQEPLRFFNVVNIR
jgi:selenocysteine lyase/cysteine desulfurase